jgi:hypothetical protein
VVRFCDLNVISVLVFGNLLAFPVLACEKPLLKDELIWVSDQSKDSAFFIEVLQASPTFREAIAHFVNQSTGGSSSVSRLDSKQDSLDYYLGYWEKLQSLPNGDRPGSVDRLLSIRLKDIKKRYLSNLGGRAPDLQVLAYSAYDIFEKDDVDGFKERLAAASSGVPSKKKLDYEKEVKNPERTRAKLETLAPLWIPKEEKEIAWIPEAARNPEFLMPLLENSPQFRKVVVELYRRTDRPGITEQSSTGDLYFALLSTMQNPGSDKRFGLAKTVNYFVLSILEMYVRNAGGDPTELYEKNGKLRRPRTFAAFSEVFFDLDTRQNWAELFAEVLVEDDKIIGARPRETALVTPEKKGLVHATDLSKMWSQVDEKITYLDGQFVNPVSVSPNQKSVQIPYIVQPTILNPNEVWSKAFDHRLKFINAELKEFQEYQNVVFEFQVEYLKRAEELGPNREMDDEAFLKWTEEFAKARMRNYREQMFVLNYMRKVAYLAQVFYYEWNHPKNGPNEKKKLLEILRFNILPPMQNVEYASLFNRFRRLLFRGKGKVVNYDLISRIFRDINGSDDFAYKEPDEKIDKDAVEELANF